MYGLMMPKKQHNRAILVAIVVGLLAGALATYYGLRSGRGAGDLSWPICAVRELASAGDPYGPACRPVSSIDGAPMPTNPLPTALLVAPLALLPSAGAAGVFAGLSAGLLAYGVVRRGEPWRLLMLASYPAFACVMLVNWSMLLVAALYLPALGVLLVAKPHVGAAVWIGRPTWYAVAGGALLVLVSLLVRPSWPGEWLATLGGYSGAPALLALPWWASAQLLWACALCWRSPRVRYLLACAALPLRAAYDWLLLLALAQSWRELALMVVASWLGFFAVEVGAPALALSLAWAPAVLSILRDRNRDLYTWPMRRRAPDSALHESPL